MAVLTIRNLDDRVKTLLRIRASIHDRSMEEEARLILAEAVDQETAATEGLGTAIHQLFSRFGGVELDPQPRELVRDPPKFD